MNTGFILSIQTEQFTMRLGAQFKNHRSALPLA